MAHYLHTQSIPWSPLFPELLLICLCCVITVASKKSANRVLPRILKCGHSFCDKCIQEKLFSSAKDENDCDVHFVICPFPTCQVKSTLSENDVNSLQIHKFVIGSLTIESTLRNQHTQRLLRLLEKKPSELILAQTTPEKCLNCQQAAAESMCEKCDGALMCQPCFVEVHRSRILASHKPVKLNEKGDFVTPEIDLPIGEMCLEHPDRQREYFCVDCSVAMCSDCGVLGSHSGHSVNRLDAINQQVRPKLVETREQAVKALDLVHQTKQKLSAEKSNSNGDGLTSNPTIENIEEVFAKLHAMLQLKQHDIEESVFNATGNNIHLLKSIEEEVTVAGKKFQHLVNGLDRVLTNAAFEKSCDFNLINATAQQVLKLPCHLVINDLSDCSNVKIDVNEEILNSFSDLVSISSQSPSRNRYELTSIDAVSEEDLQSCPSIKRSQSASSVRQPPVGMQSDPVVHSVNSISVVSNGSTSRRYSMSSISPSSSHASLSRQSSNSFELSTASMSHQQQQQHRCSNRLPQHQPFYGVPLFDMLSPTGQVPHPICGPQLNYIPPRSPGYYAPHGCEDVYNQDPTINSIIEDYHHQPAARSRGAPLHSQDARLDPGSTFENHETSARQYNHHKRYQQPPQEPQEFKSRDVRLSDPHYQQLPDFTVYRDGPHPLQTSPFQAAYSRPPGKTIGRGRGAPAPIFGPAPTPSSQYAESPHTKKLYMRPSQPISENSLLVHVSHIESPGCIYIQHPMRMNALKKLQLKIKEHCQAQPALTDPHNMKLLLARVNAVWRRAEVMKVLDRKVQVFCPDYGFTAYVKFGDLRKTAGALLSLPKAAVKCCLQGVQPLDGGNDWGDTCAEEMRGVLNHVKNVILVKLETPNTEDDHLPVDLLLRDENKSSLLSMRDYLVFIERAVWDSPISPYIPDQKILNQAYLKPLPLNEGDYVFMFITHIADPHEIYCQIVNRQLDDNETSPESKAPAELLKLDSLMRSMSEKYGDLRSLLTHKVLIPKPGDAVAASYNGEWFRAQIIALQPGHVKVKYVDYGNSEIIPANQIRVLPNDFKQLPAQAVRISIYGVTPVKEEGWNPKMCQEINQNWSESHCRVNIIKVTDKCMQVVIKMNNTGEIMGDVLVKNGLAKRSQEEVTTSEGVECKCTYAESPGEFYMLPLHLAEPLQNLTAELNRIMGETEADGSSVPSNHKWQVNAQCVLKYGANWVRAIIEELKSDTDRCMLRLIDSGHLISKPSSSLRMIPEVARQAAMTTIACIAGIIPAGGSKSWGMTAKDTIKELIEGCESCKVIPKGQAQEKLPCDILVPEELPSKVKGQPGETQYISVREKLLDTGVALRGEIPVESPKSVPSGSMLAATRTKNVAVTNMGKPQESVSAEVGDSDISRLPDAEVGSVLSANQESLQQCNLAGFESNSPAVVSKTNKAFQMTCSGSSRMIKSPGGTIRSQFVDQSSSRSSTPRDQTAELLEAAASALVQKPDRVCSNDWSAAENSSSSDLATPDLCAQLDRVLGKTPKLDGVN